MGKEFISKHNFQNPPESVPYLFWKEKKLHSQDLSAEVQ